MSSNSNNIKSAYSNHNQEESFDAPPAYSNIAESSSSTYNQQQAPRNAPMMATVHLQAPPPPTTYFMQPQRHQVPIMTVNYPRRQGLISNLVHLVTGNPQPQNTVVYTTTNTVVPPCGYMSRRDRKHMRRDQRREIRDIRRHGGVVVIDTVRQPF